MSNITQQQEQLTQLQAKLQEWVQLAKQHPLLIKKNPEYSKQYKFYTEVFPTVQQQLSKLEEQQTTLVAEKEKQEGILAERQASLERNQTRLQNAIDNNDADAEAAVRTRLQNVQDAIGRTLDRISVVDEQLGIKTTLDAPKEEEENTSTQEENTTIEADEEREKLLAEKEKQEGILAERQASFKRNRSRLQEARKKKDRSKLKAIRERLIAVRAAIKRTQERLRLINEQLGLVTQTVETETIEEEKTANTSTEENNNELQEEDNEEEEEEEANQQSNKHLSKFEGSGSYMVNLDKGRVRIVDVATVEDFEKMYKIDLAKVIDYKLIKNKQVVLAFEKAMQLHAETKISMGDIFAMAQANVSVAKQVSENITAKAEASAKASSKTTIDEHGLFSNSVAEAKVSAGLDLPYDMALKLDAYIKGYATVVATATSFIAEVGAAAEVKIALNFGDFASFSASAYAKATAGVYASLAGIKAAAVAEVGVKATVKAEVASFGDYRFDLSVTFKAYGKAEAKALIGQGGLGASASAKVGVKATIAGDLLYKEEKVGTVAIHSDAALSAGIGADIVLKLKAEGQRVVDGVAFSLFKFQVGISATLAVGVEIKFGGDILISEKVIAKGQAKVIKTVEKILLSALEKIGKEKILAELNKAKQEIEHYAKKVADVGKKVQENMINTAQKQVAGLVGLTDHSKAMKMELSRHQSKLKKYKKEFDTVEQALKDKGIKDLGKKKLSTEEQAKLDATLQEILDGLEDPSEDIKALLKDRKRKDLSKDLKKFAKKYDRRIAKINKFVEGEYDTYVHKVNKHYHKFVAIIEDFQQMQTIDKKQKSKLKSKLKKEIGKLENLKPAIDKIINELGGLDDEGIDQATIGKFTDLLGKFDEVTTKIEDVKNELLN